MSATIKYGPEGAIYPGDEDYEKAERAEQKAAKKDLKKAERAETKDAPEGALGENPEGVMTVEQVEAEAAGLLSAQETQTTVSETGEVVTIEASDATADTVSSDETGTTETQDDPSFDPSAYKVAEVLAYFKTASDKEVKRVQKAEAKDQNRKTIVEFTRA